MSRMPISGAGMHRCQQEIAYTLRNNKIARGRRSHTEFARQGAIECRIIDKQGYEQLAELAMYHTLHFRQPIPPAP